MKKEIFKVGDEVYHHDYGWGIVKGVNMTGNYHIMVSFDKEVVFFTSDGRYRHDLNSPSLSFTEYNLVTGGLSQERPEPDWSEYIGKWGKFWDKNGTAFIISKLDKVNVENEFLFECVYAEYRFFQPLTDEQIKILELE